MSSFFKGTGRLPTSESSPATGYLSCVQKPEAVVHAMKVGRLNSPFHQSCFKIGVKTQCIYQTEIVGIKLVKVKA